MPRHFIFSSKILHFSLILFLFFDAGCGHSFHRPVGPASATPSATAQGEKASAATSPAGEASRNVAVASVQKSPSTPTATPASQPIVLTKEQRLAELSRLLKAEIADKDLTQSKVSLLAIVPGKNETIFSYEPEAHRVPASNAKIFTSAAAALLLPGKYNFSTEISRKKINGPLYLSSTGDSVLTRADVWRLARLVHEQGVKQIRGGIVVDETKWGRSRLAPGFESFAADSFFRPLVGSLSLDSNAIDIRVSPAGQKKRPKVEINPQSDYLRVRNQARILKAKKGMPSRINKIKVKVTARGAGMTVIVSGVLGTHAPAFKTKHPVADPAIFLGMTLIRALKEQGIIVRGGVRRGKRPTDAKVLAVRQRSLSDILTAVNRHSDNLSAETLVRAMASLELSDDAAKDAAPSKKKKKITRRQPKLPVGSWDLGLTRMRKALAELGVENYDLKNGSGLNRQSWVTSQTVVDLLSKIYSTEHLWRLLGSTYAVAGKSGTLTGRMRGTAADGYIQAKTGTLGGALALSGVVNGGSSEPIIFSLLVNGRSDKIVRGHMDRMAQLLARYARNMPLVTEQPTSAPTEEAVDEEDLAPPDPPSTQPAIQNGDSEKEE